MHKFDAHRLVGLICRYPRHKWHFKVWQMMWIKLHVKDCYECNMRIDELQKKSPKIGPTQENN